MKITVFGVGYVGLTVGVCFSEMGHQVLCMDIDSEKINSLKRNKCPIYEPGLEELLKKNVTSKRLSFSKNFNEALNFSDLLFITLGTPISKDGDLDLTYINSLVEDIAKNSTKPKTLVIKSTIPPGTVRKIQSYLNKKYKNQSFSVVSNPEFMKEGNSINDFLKPDRIIIGSEDEQALVVLREIYNSFNRNSSRIIEMDSTSAELTKYAANAMLATRISFMNELSQLSEKINADIELIRQGLISDPRIGKSFLYAGLGYGGSCFPKDVRGLIKLYENHGLDALIPGATNKVNESQKEFMLNKILGYFGEKNLKRKSLAFLGLSFKPDTDDLREAPALFLINKLENRVNKIKVYDPLSHRNKESLSKLKVEIEDDIYSCCRGVDAIIISTEWKEFRSIDLNKISKEINEKVIFDGRNMFNRENLLNLGWKYFNIGTKADYE